MSARSSRQYVARYGRPRESVVIDVWLISSCPGGIGTAISAADLKIAYRLLAGWHPNDPFSVPAALEGPAVRKRAAIVTQMPYSTLPESTVAAIRKAGQVLAVRAMRSKTWCRRSSRA